MKWWLRPSVSTYFLPANVSFKQTFKKKGGSECGEDKPVNNGEFLSGIYRDDKLVPVKTLIVYFNTGHWDGPRTLHDMLDMEDWTEEEKQRIPDYPLSILEPSRLTEEELESMHSDLGVVLGFIKYSTDRKKLDDYVHKHKEFSTMADESTRLLNEVCSLHLDTIIENEIEEKGEIDLCKAIEDMKDDAREEGRSEGEIIKVISQICRKLVKGKDIETIADELEEEPAQIEEICRIAKMYAPDYDVDKIYEQLQKSYV